MGLEVGSRVIINLAKLPVRLQDKLGSNTEGIVECIIVLDNADYCTVKIERDDTSLPLKIDIPISAVLEI